MRLFERINEGFSDICRRLYVEATLPREYNLEQGGVSPVQAVSMAAGAAAWYYTQDMQDTELRGVAVGLALASPYVVRKVLGKK